MTRTLVVHPGALGDVLLAIPALRALRRRVPESELVLAARSHIASLVRELAEVDAHVRFETLGLDALFTGDGHAAGLLALGPLDRVVCWFGARDPAFARRLREIAPEAVVAPSVPAFSPSASALDTGAVWRHLVATATGDACGNDRFEIATRECVRVSPALVGEGRRALESAGWDGARPLLVAHPGAGGGAKRWPVDGFARVIGRLADRFTITVHEGPADREAARALVAGLDVAAVHLDTPSLPTLAGALVHAALYVGNDCGVSHLAAAVGVPSVVLFRRDLLPWAPWVVPAEIAVVSTNDLLASDERAVAAALERVRARQARCGSCAAAAHGVRASDA